MLQLRHHVSALGLSFSLSVKSASIIIIYIALVFSPNLVFREQNEVITQIVPPSAICFYRKAAVTNIPLLSDNNSRHA